MNDPNFYATYLDRHLEPATSAPEPVKTDKPRRVDYASYAEYAAAVYERYGAHGSMGAVDVEGDWRRQLAIGNALLSGEWEAVPFQIQAADERWIKRWKGWTAWGWFSYGGIAVLTVMSGAPDGLMAALNFFFWWLVFWPCILFTVIALAKRGRVGWPIFLVNLRWLWIIVKTILIWAVIICSAGLLLNWVTGLFKKSTN